MANPSAHDLMVAAISFVMPRLELSHLSATAVEIVTQPPLRLPHLTSKVTAAAGKAITAATTHALRNRGMDDILLLQAGWLLGCW
jgi:hypothetical protein